MSDLRDRVALITGASGGIGRATAEAFAAKGASVVLAARREDELAALANKIKDQGGKASFVTTDVSVAQDVERMVAYTLETHHGHHAYIRWRLHSDNLTTIVEGHCDLPNAERENCRTSGSTKMSLRFSSA
jgi:NAD(P)-dependent dehydrogenase (short-subunit alcohol dehydrogenase family)